jgi:hypothetical protein
MYLLKSAAQMQFLNCIFSNCKFWRTGPQKVFKATTASASSDFSCSFMANNYWAKWIEHLLHFCSKSFFHLFFSFQSFDDVSYTCIKKSVYFLGCFCNPESMHSQTKYHFNIATNKMHSICLYVVRKFKI